MKRSERSVRTAFAELVEMKWIICAGGGNGTASKIIVINAIDWISACDSRLTRKTACDRLKPACDSPRIRVKVKTLEQAPAEAQSDIHNLVKKNLGTWQMGGWYDGYSRVWRRPGMLPDAGTLARIAEGIGAVELYQEFQRRALGPLQTAQSWGLIVNIAREVGLQRKPMGVENAQLQKQMAR